MSWDFKAGDRVVCLTSDWESEGLWHRFKDKLIGRPGPDPVENGVYTIHAVISYPCGGYLQIKECQPDHEEWRAEHFRPLTSSYDWLKIARKAPVSA